MPTPMGYSHLVNRYSLRVLPLAQEASIATDIKGREIRQQGGKHIALFEPKYQPEDSLKGHLQFALRYEGVNLQILTLLFAKTGKQDLTDWISNSPESRYARTACFLYEWLTGKSLQVQDPVPSRASYVKIADPALQLAFPHGEKHSRFRVQNNLPGTRNFCPLVRMTDYLQGMISADLRRTTAMTLERYDQDLLRRAAAYLYLKETQSSFEVEREKPTPQKAQRFADLLRQADTQEPLIMERLVKLQQVVVDPRFHEFTWRKQQNWLGKDLGYRQQIDFVPPRPEDVPGLMTGLLAMAAEYQNLGNGRILSSPDPVIMAAAIAFGFIYIHPFMDGNGRIHRYLIHDVLAKAGFTPRGIVLPVSAVILSNLDEYIATLEQFSKPVNQLTDFDPTQPELSASGNDSVFFCYPDLTAQAEFLYKVLERTVAEDLQSEIDYLLGFDRAVKALNAFLDWPAHSMELFIRVVRENDGTLSANKRKSHFEWMRDEEIHEAERLVKDAFVK
ncbi:MAG: Fic family protein [Gammaproteobacteria bacterium]|nr:Fic family protein [Pseudomonadales bacterium]